MAQVILFNKPFGVLSQFTSEGGHATLADYIDAEGFYAAGRLDKDSEGLLVLTDDGKLQERIANPRFRHTKTYLVQVEGVPDDSAIQQLIDGVELKDGLSLPAEVKVINAPRLWPRNPPVRFRKHIPTSWLEMTIREGRNRQVRRMTAAVGFPTLRLVRVAVGDWQIADLEPGDWVQLAVQDP